jgi:hypothetical protein
VTEQFSCDQYAGLQRIKSFPRGYEVLVGGTKQGETDIPSLLRRSCPSSTRIRPSWRVSEMLKYE